MLVSLSQSRLFVLVLMIAIGCLTTVFFIFREGDNHQFFQQYKDLILFSDGTNGQISSSSEVLSSKTEAIPSNTHPYPLSESSAPPASNSSDLHPLSDTNVTSISNVTAVSNVTNVANVTDVDNVTDAPPMSNDGSLTYGNMTSSPRILQTSMLFKGMNNDISDRCLQSHLDHGARHGYKLSVLRTEFMMVNENENDKKKKRAFSPIIWDKPLYILSTLIDELSKPTDEQAEWIVYVDVDTILLNPSIPWSTFLPPSSFPNDKIHFIGSHDWSSFNAGVFMIRVHPWSVRLLNAAIAVPVIRPDVPLYSCIDQNALKWVLSSEGFKEQVIYQPSHWWNGIATPWKPMPEVKDGDMLVHFAGAQKGHNKTELIGEWLDGKEGPKKRDIKIKDTAYEKEVKEFWETHTNARKAIGDTSKYLKKEPEKDVRKAIWKKKLALDEVADDFFYNSKKIQERTKELNQAVKSASEKKKNGR